MFASSNRGSLCGAPHHSLRRPTSLQHGISRPPLFIAAVELPYRLTVRVLAVLIPAVVVTVTLSRPNFALAGSPQSRNIEFSCHVLPPSLVV